MVDHEDEELKMAFRMSMQHDSLDQPGGSNWAEVDGDVEADGDSSWKTQRELMATNVEKSMVPSDPVEAVKVDISGGEESESSGVAAVAAAAIKLEVPVEGVVANWGKKLSVEEAQKLFSIIFGEEVTKDILAQWSNQGIRFSPDPETSVGLVQHAGGPCGVLATLQAFILKHIFFLEKSAYTAISMEMDLRRAAQRECIAADIFSSLKQERKSRALVISMCEILFLCGNNLRAVIASIGDLPIDTRTSEDSTCDDVIAKVLEGVVIESGHDLHKALRVEVHTSRHTATQRLKAMLPHFRSRMGATLFLISSLLSRGLESVQTVCIICAYCNLS